MTQEITVKSVYEAFQERLRFTWIANPDSEIQISGKIHKKHALIGHLNLIHPNRIQVLGPPELDYLRDLPEKKRDQAVASLFTFHPALIIICDKSEIPDYILNRSQTDAVPLWHSDRSSNEVITDLQYALTNWLAERVTLHGVFMDVFGIGVLITGESGIGKSELALELISRGHSLIADDAPEFIRVAPDTLNGTCPSPLADFLEVRGLGVLNIRQMFGDAAIKNNRFLRLILNMQPLSSEAFKHIDRLQGTCTLRTHLDIQVPEVMLPVAPGRNLAVLAEAAVRDYHLRSLGYDAGQTLLQRQSQQMERQER